MRSTRAEGNFRFMNSRDKTRNSYVLGPKRTLGSWNSRDKTLETDVCVLLHLISCCSQEAGGGREPLASNYCSLHMQQTDFHHSCFCLLLFVVNSTSGHSRGCSYNRLFVRER
jgi:hypothetical protein